MYIARKRERERERDAAPPRAPRAAGSICYMIYKYLYHLCVYIYIYICIYIIRIYTWLVLETSSVQGHTAPVSLLKIPDTSIGVVWKVQAS